MAQIIETRQGETYRVVGDFGPDAYEAIHVYYYNGAYFDRPMALANRILRANCRVVVESV